MKKSLLLALTLAALAAAIIVPGCSPAKKPIGVDQRVMRDLADDVTVQRAFIDGRWAAIQRDRDFRQDALQENMNEKRKMFDDKDIRAQMLELNMDLVEKTLADPKQKQRLMEVQLDLLEGIAKDPKLRPKLIALVKDLIGEQSLKAELRRITRIKAGAVTPPKAATPPTTEQQPPSGGGPGTTPPGQQEQSATPPAAP